ncbi:putative cyclin-dependent serine/threonine-protein kinase DDB_G0272797/DDB_G0274007 [Megalobrama amblycephala]|uniref:putative cyclin-dependent serine/threonine-protein kinase DDB_G0272797/DDB_G0274007 n=1 Tax=Megalobrama amblycephala TaxID=75352 RepID=UPI002014669F|nr:putative cyclin-dependent serine/threonine-protein kinase DDB_G0272797/DDB_G0274007 [Megalobrama amblycephala]XP_048054485.1 putative cyclin-dependent serine/threonine-protein kinase DDB_G0272797/DDB_G0274007 [Megalobrama amblycephala]
MRSRIPLLLAVLAAACLRFGSAEADPLPAAVVELVKGGSVSSIQDLQFLLFSESIEVEPDIHHENDTSNRLPRSLLDAQPAQQAICKIRTEVIEVTRSMLDRSNANFLLWPPCVEVQRCSGCCNTKTLQCVPVLTHTRYLQVMKIQYVNKRPLYDKAVVSVIDHVECRCQPAPRPAQRRKSSGQKLDARDRSGKTRPKVELHSRDELKHNQRLSLDDLFSHSWLPKERFSESGAPDTFHFGHDGWDRNETQYGGGKGHHRHPTDRRRHSNTNGTSTQGTMAPLPNHTEQEETISSLHNVTQFESQSNANQSTTNQTSEYNMGPLELTNQTFKHQSNLTQEIEKLQTTNQTEQLAFNATETASQNLGDVEENGQKVRGETSDVEVKEEEREQRQMDRKAKEQEMEDLLLQHKLLEEQKHKHHLKIQQTNRQPDEKLQQLHHKQQHTYTTTQRTGTTSPPLQHLPAHKPHRPPPHPPKRKRKQRNRISKSAMRALLM